MKYGTCRRCSNYIFILDLTPGFNGLGKNNCKTRREWFSSFVIWCVLYKMFDGIDCLAPLASLTPEDNDGQVRVPHIYETGNLIPRQVRTFRSTRQLIKAPTSGHPRHIWITMGYILQLPTGLRSLPYRSLAEMLADYMKCGPIGNIQQARYLDQNACNITATTVWFE